MKVRLLIATLLLVLIATPAYAHRMPPKHLSASQARHKATIVRVGHSLHLSRPEIRAMLILGWRESGWRPTARNGNCRGAFQLNFRHMGRKWRNLAWNTRRANRYVKHRYGSWRRALAHSYRCNWY